MERRFNGAEPEWMDRPQPVSAELRSDLRNLMRLNRYFGSYRLVLEMLKPVLIGRERVRILDLATGAGDIPRMLVGWGRRHGVRVEVVAVDAMAATLAIAREWSGEFPEIRFELGDARCFATEELFDGVMCSLALHHFSPEDAVAVLRRMRGLTEGWLLAADLVRGRWAQAAIWCLTEVWMREAMTRNDARVSIERAFSYGEFAELVRAAGWEGWRQRRFPVARQAIFCGEG